MQSKINLKFPETIMTNSYNDLSQKKMMSSQTGFVKKFNSKFDQECNTEYLKVKNRNVSNSSPFYRHHVPPKEYLEIDSKLPKNPTK